MLTLGTAEVADLPFSVALVQNVRLSSSLSNCHEPKTNGDPLPLASSLWKDCVVIEHVGEAAFKSKRQVKLMLIM